MFDPSVAFKEWAVICRALADGRQSLILRKGGIAESGGVFRPEHERFWLFPTYVHQQREGIKQEARSLLDAVEAERPPAGTVRLSHQVEVIDVRFIDKLDEALALDGHHIWSPETVRMRFNYRQPGLYVLNVRVKKAALSHELFVTPEMEGCTTWVDLRSVLTAASGDG